jgi:hypothetical protein
LVAVKGKAAPAIDMPPRTVLAPPQAIALPQQERGGLAALQPPNFRISAEFRRSFNTYVARSGSKRSRRGFRPI